MPHPRAPEVEYVTLHGNRIAFRRAGDAGPVVLLIHGMAATSATWDRVIGSLAQTCTVIAPDLLGHGSSAKPGDGDYSIGGLASGLRDLMTLLGHDRATIVGHSLGGGVALQFAYQFPQLCERLVLVSSGGLGKEVHPILRAASLPGFSVLIRAFSGTWMSSGGLAVGRTMRRVGLRPGTDAQQSWESLCSFAEADTRAAFIKTIRSVIATSGQSVSALSRLYLAAAVPTLVVWGDKDPIIPVSHAEATHALIPGSRLKVVPGARHYPHRDDPAGFSEALLAFIAETDPAETSPEQWRELLAAEAARSDEAAPSAS